MVEDFLFLIPLLPFLGFLINGLVGKRLPRPVVSTIACAGPAIATVLGALAFVEVAGGDRSQVLQWPSWDWDWIRVGEDLHVPFGFAVDRLSAVMTLVVAGVGTLIHIYSAGYMREDPGYARYFAYLNLFMAAMLVLVLADNIVLLFLGWEGVGLCSYLLIGFWYKDLGNCQAGIKAFVVNRIGDFGFLLGIFLIFVLFGAEWGGNSIFEFRTLGAAVTESGAQHSTGLAWIAVLLFIGATGKSAQIPLYVWLPNAMAGPTPVSALIHAATMVTSGIYMVSRLWPLYEAVPGVLLLIAVVGVVTAFFSALIALTQTDIKKVLAYSTVSQLGYMFFSLGLGAYAVAIFHLVTHAFFKGLLFLGAGAVIHALHHEQDMQHMGGLRKKIPLTATVFIIGALALGGFPLTSGFFSKDAILHEAMLKAFFHDGFQLGWCVLWALGFATAILTAFYVFRQVCLVFFGEYRGNPDHGLPADKIHEAPPVMTVPLVILAVLALAGGALAVPGFLHQMTEAEAHAHHEGQWLGWGLGALASVVGISCALILFLKAPALRQRLALGTRLGRFATRLSYNKFYIDELYDFFIVKPLRLLSILLFYVIDRAVIDWLLVTGSGHLVRGAGLLFRKVQTGRIPSYVVWFLVGSIGLLIMVFRFL